MEQGQEQDKGKEFIRLTMERLMGECLDAGKLSDMGERQLAQFIKNMKNKFNDVSRLFEDRLKLKDDN